MKSWYLLTVLWLATDHQPEGWFPYLWQHDIWQEEMVPMIEDYGWQDLYILRDPAGIFMSYEGYRDLSIVSLLITGLSLRTVRFHTPMVKLTRFERERLASSLRHGRFPEGGSLANLLEYLWYFPA